jgi:polyphosphate glucokinase
MQGFKMDFLGIDIGCTTIKYGLVSFGDEIRVNNFDMVLVPQTSRPETYIDLLLHIVQNTGAFQTVGFGFPTRVWGDETKNLIIKYSDIWVEVRNVLRARKIICCATNDADAAGMAEVYRPEAAVLRKGVTIVLTLGTGIGSAIFNDGKLLPNTELGLMDLHNMPAEKYTAASVKTREELSLMDWASRLQEYIMLVEKIFVPDHLVLGGGISAEFDEYRKLLNTSRAKLLPAFYRNQAGVIGAAMFAAHQTRQYDFFLETDPRVKAG